MSCRHCIHASWNDAKSFHCAARLMTVPRDGYCHRYMREIGAEG